MNIQIIRRSTLIGAGLLLSILSPILVHAGCVQGDLKGTWYTHSMSIDSAFIYAPQVSRCKIKINTSGTIVASSSSCKARTYDGLHSGNVTGGKIDVSSKCSLSGSMKAYSSGSTARSKIEYGKLSKDKTTFSAIGYSADNPDWIYHLSGVKQ